MNKRFTIIGVVCAIMAIALGVYAWKGSALFGRPEVEQPPLTQVTETVSPASESPSEVPTETPSESPSEESDYVSPIDFAALEQRNPDIYAWLEIPGTEISYPLLRSPGNDDLYLDHDVDGGASQAGALFTEASYNGDDFSDMVTVIYGHNMRNGSMFGDLQDIYADADQFAAKKEIVIYQADQELHYEVFAAIPFNDRHLLYQADYSDEDTYQLLLNEFYSVRLIGANFSDSPATVQDKILVLSTCCYGGENASRYFVIAKLV